ncbi:MYND-type domain-containing protein [Mycena sanguinolenta]|uniref:MYND-type domain-containing protein n=1 Tax=Mycena sanguinolenta TaxID=230812 RepID=A0A8H6WMQ3_9AGAR|nr:MYND-type domain-containing protein [Mycena sanguinolenta]
MHASLNGLNLSMFPQSLRVIRLSSAQSPHEFIGLKMRATAAASGSHDETLALISDIEDMAPKHRPLLIPVFCVGLKPANIPRILARFDSFGWTSIRSEIVQAHLCLRGIWELGNHKAIVTGAFVDLWKRIWPWVEFLDEYEETLSDEDFLDGETRYSGFLSLMRFLRGDKAAAHLIDSTPGLYVVVRSAWRHFIDAEDEAGLADVSYFLGLLFKNDWNAPTFDELIIGAGGTRSDLASIVVSHITHVLPDPDSPVTSQTIFHLVGIVYIVASESVTGYQDPEFQDDLLSHGIVAALTTAVRALCRSTLETAGIELKGLLPALVDQLSLCSPTYLPESLRAGLLDIIFTSQHREVMSSSLTALLENVLPPATVYHSVLMELQTPSHKLAIAMPQQYSVIPPFSCSGTALWLWLKWTPSNIQESVVTSQGTDEITGELHISPRNRSFLRVLVYHEYMVREQEVAQKKLLFMEQHPGRCAIKIWRLENFAPDFELDAERIVRSAGQLHLHLMHVVDADHTETLIWLFPLRLGSSHVRAR